MPSARLFLIGEAAHIILPSAGNGVNDAIADAVTACSGTNVLVARVGMRLAGDQRRLIG